MLLLLYYTYYILLHAVLLYSSEICTLETRQKDKIEGSELWVWITIERTKWVDRVSNVGVLKRAKEGR